MPCPDKDLIFRYADGEVNDAERREAEKHIQECRACREQYEEYKGMMQLLTQHWDGKLEDCIDTRTLAEYSMGMAVDAVKKQIEEHVAGCEVCASELQLMRQMDADISELEAVVPTEAVESDDQVYAALMERRREILESMPMPQLVKRDFIQAARRLTEKFIGRYHESEGTLLENFWRMFSPMYSTDVRFGKAALDSRASAMVGDSGGYESPPIIFAMLGVCDHIQNSAAVDEDKLIRIIKDNEKRFGIPRRERRKLREFLIQEFLDLKSK